MTLLLLIAVLAALVYLLVRWVRWDARREREEVHAAEVARILDDDDSFDAAGEADDFELWTAQCADLRKWARRLKAP